VRIIAIVTHRDTVGAILAHLGELTTPCDGI
jgi:hypothetical protein